MVCQNAEAFWHTIFLWNYVSIQTSSAAGAVVSTGAAATGSVLSGVGDSG